jgi:hypothetical protein
VLENSLNDRPPSTSRSATNRSAVTNGRRLFIEGDARSPWARRWKDLVELHAGDLSPGGIDLLSEAQLSLIKRASAIEVELEQAEGRMSMGEEVDLDIFTRSTSHLRRILETLGIERRQHDVTPTLAEYLRAATTAEDAVQDARQPCAVSSGIAQNELAAIQEPGDVENASSASGMPVGVTPDSAGHQKADNAQSAHETALLAERREIREDRDRTAR